ALHNTKATPSDCLIARTPETRGHSTLARHRKRNEPKSGGMALCTGSCPAGAPVTGRFPRSNPISGTTTASSSRPTRCLDRADPRARQTRPPRQLLLRPAAASTMLAEMVLERECLRHDRIFFSRIVTPRGVEYNIWSTRL